MIRTEIINFLIEERGFKRYLEIGVHDEQHNFSQINCKFKIGVDLKNVTTFQGTSDDFFSQNREKYDIIFIDSIHTEEQVLKDVGNSIRCLSKGGIILIHDCLPPDEWHQRSLEEFKEGENWNGTVWKAVLRIFNYAKYRCLVIDTDWGCGIIDTAKTQSPLCLDIPENLNYMQHFPLLQKYKVDPSTFFREHVNVFYHLACIGNWCEVFQEQISALHRNGFTKLALSVLGTADDLKYVNAKCEKMKFEFNIIFHSPEFTNFEKPSMVAIENYAKYQNGFVLYLHSKGVSSPSDETKIKWRHLMMNELIEKWQDCMKQLPKYDIIGVNWRDMPPISHFCGNFWYASTRYLRTLDDFNYYYEHPKYDISGVEYNKRLGCEFWIGSGQTEPKLLSLVCKNIDFCNPRYWNDR